MSKEQSNSGSEKLPIWYYPTLMFGIPGFSALLASPPFTVCKQLQNNAQLGTNTPVLKFEGLSSTAKLLVLRTIARLSLVPFAKEYAGNNHPEWMTKSTAKNLATIITSITGDVINSPFDLVAAKQQSWQEKSSKPKPSFSQYYKESKTLPEFFKKLYGFDGHLNGAPPKSVALRGGTYLTFLILARDGINKTINQDNQEGKILANLLAVSAGIFADGFFTPLSAIVQRTMRIDNPQIIKEAAKEVFGNGIMHAYKGLPSRLFIGIVGSGLMVGALNLQEKLEEAYKNNSRSR